MDNSRDINTLFEKEKGSTLISFIIIGILIIGTAVFIINNERNGVLDENSSEVASEINVQDSDISDDSDNMVDSDSDEDVVMGVGTYEDYSPEKVVANNGAILFFHASWCPTCQALDSNLKNSLEKIPEGVAILKVSYDKETELKKKYEVTYQHVLVQVDAEGNLIQKWSGDITLDQILNRI